MTDLSLGDLIRPARLVRAEGDEFPILSMTMHGGLVDQADKFKKRIASEDASAYKVVRHGQLVVGFPIDEGVLDFQLRYAAGIVSPAYGVWDLKDATIVEPKYLKRYLRSGRAMGYYKAKLRGSTARRRSLPTDVFLALPVFLPPLEEQRRIAAILDQADALRAKRRQVLAQLEKLIESRFNSLFEGANDPATWPVRHLGEIAETRLGKMLDAKNQTGRDGRRYLRNANVQWFNIDTSDLLTMDFDLADRKTFALRAGDVLVCEGGQPGRSAVWRGELEDCYFQKALHRVRMGPEILPEYFVRYMKRLLDRGMISDFVTSATIAHLTGEKLRTLPIVVPPMQLQSAWTRDLSVIEAQIAMEHRLTATADDLFASLQSRAFRGEL